MLRFRSLVVSIVLWAAIGGCAFPGPAVRPGATEAELRAAMGRPSAELPNADGSRTLAYSHGPFGTEAYVAEVGADGRVRSLRAVLNEETFQRIAPGMTQDEVVRLVGPPGDRMAFPNLRQDSWEWRFVDAWGYPSVFSVNFDRAGRVVSKFTRRLERRGGMLF